MGTLESKWINCKCPLCGKDVRVEYVWDSEKPLKVVESEMYRVGHIGRVEGCICPVRIDNEPTAPGAEARK